MGAAAGNAALAEVDDVRVTRAGPRGIKRHAGIIVLAVYVLGSLWSFGAADTEHLLGRFSDDAYYYFTIASNYARAGSLTFDGQNATNGFHPLWLASLLPVFHIVGDRFLVLRVVGVISTLLLGGAALIGWRVVVRWHGWAASVLGLLIVLVYLRVLNTACMETSLLVFLCMVALALLDRADPWGRPGVHWHALLTIGLLLSTAQLARLDAVFLNLSIVASVAVVSWRRFGYRVAVARVSLLGLPCLLTGAGYVFWNYAHFGHVVPVSGAVKSLGARGINVKFLQQLLHLPGAADAGLQWAVYTLLFISTLVWLTLAARRLGRRRVAEGAADRGGPPVGVGLAIALFCLAFTSWYLVSSSWHLWGWYTYPAFFVGIFVAPDLADSVLRTAPRVLSRSAGWAATAVVAACLVLSLHGGVWAYRAAAGGFVYRNYEFASLLNTELEDDGQLAMGGCAGSFGYFYKGDVLQLEGLVGSYDVVDAIRENTLSDYMARFGVTHVVAFADLPEEYGKWTIITPDGYHTTGPKAKVVVHRADEIRRDDSGRRSLVIWRWPGGGGERGVGPAGHGRAGQTGVRPCCVVPGRYVSPSLVRSGAWNASTMRASPSLMVPKLASSGRFLSRLGLRMTVSALRTPRRMAGLAGSRLSFRMPAASSNVLPTSSSGTASPSTM